MRLPAYPDYVDHSFMMYLSVLKKEAPFSLDELLRHLETNNIECRPMLPLLNQPIYKKLFGDIEKDYPVAEWIDHYGFYVGCHHGLNTEQLDKIVATMKEFLGKSE